MGPCGPASPLRASAIRGRQVYGRPKSIGLPSYITPFGVRSRAPRAWVAAPSGWIMGAPAPKKVRRLIHQACSPSAAPNHRPPLPLPCSNPLVAAAKGKGFVLASQHLRMRVAGRSRRDRNSFLSGGRKKAFVVREVGLITACPELSHILMQVLRTSVSNP